MNKMKSLSAVACALSFFSLSAFADGNRGEHHGHRFGSVELFHDDGKCEQANLVGVVGAETVCSTLTGAGNVWGIRINGVCKDVSDQDAPSACEKYKGIGESGPGTVQLYHDDGKCEDANIVASIGRHTDCSKLAGMSNVWGVKIAGNCKDISDVDPVAACQQYKELGGGPAAVQLFHDDGKCENTNFVASVGPSTNCASLNGLSSIWGIKIGGVCKDISDVDAPTACEKYKGIGSTGPRGILLYHDDGKCEEGNLIAGISSETNCASLQGMSNIWGIKLNGVCKDISDMDAPAACTQFQGLGEIGPASVQLFHDDGKCEDNNLIASVGARTDCNKLAGMSSVWGIRANGVCRDVSDVDAKAACLLYTGRGQ